MTTLAMPSRRTGQSRLVIAVALLAALAISVAALIWAKWLPYERKTVALTGTHHWSGHSILSAGGVRPGDAPSWHAATSFASAYLKSIWHALVAALLISAAVSALVPPGWPARLLNRRRPITSAAVGGLLATPSLMCTCCTAPVAATLRREGAGTAGVVAYWLGNPLLNPAVLVFLALVAPWQWTVTRLAVGILVVVFGSTLVARLAGERSDPAAGERVAGSGVAVDRHWLAAVPWRFGRALLRLVLVMVPEYVAVVLLVGAVRGWLFPLGGAGGVRAGVLVLLLAAVVGTLIVIPTGGEIPIVLGLAAAGVSLGGVGALLLTLPAASLPAMAMLVRSLGWRATLASAGVVLLGGLVAGGALTALG
ncbi:MAG TPA: permease [Jatrophihabitans sp.]|nr:permease [Jatrophihabitans sp.]